MSFLLSFLPLWAHFRPEKCQSGYEKRGDLHRNLVLEAVRVVCSQWLHKSFPFHLPLPTRMADIAPRATVAQEIARLIGCLPVFQSPHMRRRIFAICHPPEWIRQTHSARQPRDKTTRAITAEFTLCICCCLAFFLFMRPALSPAKRMFTLNLKPILRILANRVSCLQLHRTTVSDNVNDEWAKKTGAHYKSRKCTTFDFSPMSGFRPQLPGEATERSRDGYRLRPIQFRWHNRKRRRSSLIA